MRVNITTKTLVEIIDSDIKTIVLLSNSQQRIEFCNNTFFNKNIELEVFGSQLDSVFMIEDKNPDLIIIDLEYSKKHSFTYVRELKSNINTKDIPLFFLSDKNEINSTPIDIQWLAEEILIYPLDSDELSLTISSYIKTNNKLETLNLGLETTLDLVETPILIIRNNDILFRNQKFKEIFNKNTNRFTDLFPKKEHQELKELLHKFSKSENYFIFKSLISMYDTNRNTSQYYINFGCDPSLTNAIIVSIMSETLFAENNNAENHVKISSDTDENTCILSEREKEVLQLAANGLSSTQIGDKLFISNRTVERHRSNLLKKLNASNLAQAVVSAIKLGAISI